MAKAHFTSSYNNVGGSASVGGEDLYDLIEAQEVAKERSWRPIQAYSFYAQSDCTVSINGDTDSIPVFSGIPLSGNGEINSFVLNTSGVTYSFLVEY